MTNTQSTRSTRESSVGDEGTLLAEVHTLYIRGGIEHLLHTWASLRTLVGDDNAVACLDLATENSLAGILLRVEHLGRT